MYRLPAPSNASVSGLNAALWSCGPIPAIVLSVYRGPGPCETVDCAHATSSRATMRKKERSTRTSQKGRTRELIIARWAHPCFYLEVMLIFIEIVARDEVSILNKNQ